MISESYKNKLRELAGIEHKYYRAIDTFIGDNVILEPAGMYERIGDNEEPVFQAGEHAISDEEETCASKYLGGAAMGAFSARNMGAKETNTFYVYEINEAPDKDISWWSSEDFMFLAEVRFRRSVPAKYIGKIILNEHQEKMLSCWYEFYSSDPYDEDDDVESRCEEFMVGDFDDYVLQELKKIKLS